MRFITRLLAMALLLVSLAIAQPSIPQVKVQFAKGQRPSSAVQIAAADRLHV